MTVIIDISPVLSPKTAVFPGDMPLNRTVAMDMVNGDHLTLSSITTTLHIGAHVDAPNHYSPDGVSIEARSLHYYVGHCQVISVSVPKNGRITPDHITVPIVAPRVLFRTDTFPDPNHFSMDFAALSPEVVAHLAQQGVILIGIDTPSIDLSHDSVLLAHNAIYQADMAILEGIVLNHVADGEYTLVAAPLPIQGADASPVRALLLPKP